MLLNSGAAPEWQFLLAALSVFGSLPHITTPLWLQDCKYRTVFTRQGGGAREFLWQAVGVCTPETEMGREGAGRPILEMAWTFE